MCNKFADLSTNALLQLMAVDEDARRGHSEGDCNCLEVCTARGSILGTHCLKKMVFVRDGC